MANNAYYFPHDANAIRDPKCAALINDFGFEGYGLYWAIIELLHEQENGKLLKFPKLYDGLSSQFRVEKEVLLRLFEALLHDYELLHQDEKYIWSERVIKNLEFRKIKHDAKVKAGQLGGLNSGISRSKTKQCLKQNEANEPKESKVKESKEKKKKEKKEKVPTPEKINFAEFVKLTQAEHDKLVAKHGTTLTAAFYEKLNNHKGAKGVKYTSDYHAILTWVIDAVMEKNGKKSNPDEGKQVYR